MDLSLVELKAELERLLQLEQAEDPDWYEVERISAEQLRLLNETGCANLIDEFVYHFLEDFDVRSGDDSYARQQREKLRLRLRK
jgi:hypothetical protein